MEKENDKECVDAAKDNVCGSAENCKGCGKVDKGNGIIVTTNSKNTVCEIEIWKHLHRKLELEINTLWQRSVFLGTFIALLLTGYGCYYSQVFLSPDCNCKLQQIDNMLSMEMPGLVLSFLMIVMGVLWFAMAKGSKYWYEIYEEKIKILEEKLLSKNQQYKYKEEYRLNIQNDGNDTQNDRNETQQDGNETQQDGNETQQDGNEKQKKGNKDGNKSNGVMRNKLLVDCKFDVLKNDKKLNKHLKAYPYSPSKINILLGWIVSLLGTFLSLFHSIRILFTCEIIIEQMSKISCVWLWIIFTVLFLLLILILLAPLFFLRFVAHVPKKD